jgi:uncharacterized repeat protein (TIGR03837 family)
MDLAKLTHCDIFCAVVDNYGDIGVSWRLAKQLVNEQNISVRLWVDDLNSFQFLCAEVNPSQAKQNLHGVEIRHWLTDFSGVTPAQLVVEAFACKLPNDYVQLMAAQSPKPIWLNLEYLSAESWVAGCHGLPSPHPNLALIKYFFFPGFTHETGGLLIEQDLFVRRDAFLADASAQEQYWQGLGVPLKRQGEVRISLFSYENPALPELLSAWSIGEYTTTCLAPIGRVLPQLAAFFGRKQLAAGDVVQKGSLRVHVLPFVSQDEYDKLLWACDFNFVRGEDSCVRAQWAGKPFVWQVYPQHDGVHIHKMRALLELYSQGLGVVSADPLHNLWEIWNRGGAASIPGEFSVRDQALSSSAALVWTEILSHQLTLDQHAKNWSIRLSSHNLALNLLDFSHKVGRIPAFEISH